ncbi:MAG: ornithine carbamoyltransferase [Hyphomicrobiales bacterium]|nr:ornithine carbamoyltransferase [Hyphomicrobiales bacterium]
MKHFIDINKIDTTELRAILDRAHAMKKAFKEGNRPRLLDGMQLAMIFEKPSTRTRVSFEVGMQQLGGHALYLNSETSQLGRGETIADTARVLSRFVDAIMIRTYKHSDVKEMAKHASVPVINGLTDYSHPCQIMADLMTYEEHRGTIAGKIVTWLGDMNNVTTSWMHAAEKFGCALRIACPEEFKPPVSKLPEQIQFVHDPANAVNDSDLIITDTWISMGDTDSQAKREALEPYQVNTTLMAQARPDALFMHCLPAHRGEEVTDDVLDGSQSVILDEAENRLHAQKAILLWCLERL